MSAPTSPSESKPAEGQPADASTHHEKPPSNEAGRKELGEADGTDNTSAPETSSAAPGSPSSKSDQSKESGEASPVSPEKTNDDAPPLPDGSPPPVEDDGWDFHWDETHQAYYFYNRFTNQTTWENPRIAVANAGAGTSAAPGGAEPPKNERPPAGGYNPAIHGDYDPNAWYAQKREETAQEQPIDPAAAYAAMGSFNRYTGRWQSDDVNPDNHNDEAKSRRQMNAYFDVDAAANAHDGRSLKAERSGKKPTKAELKQFKDKRRARKEEKRRAWLRD